MIIEFEQNLAKIWPEEKKVCFQKKFENVKTLQQNQSNRGVGGDGSACDEGFNGGDGEAGGDSGSIGDYGDGGGS